MTSTQSEMEDIESQIEEIESEYRETLLDLQENNKSMINVLTMLANEKAEECPGAPQAIVRIIETHLSQVSPQLKLFVLYLIDSIVKNCTDKPYTKLFAENLLRTFVNMFKVVDEKTRLAMHKVRLTWNDYFVPSKLHAIDVKVAEIDPAWPIQQYSGTPEGPPDLRGQEGITGPGQGTIHVNPKFLGTTVPVDREKMAAIRKQEMLRIQHERNEKEMMRRKNEIEQQQRMRGMTEKKMDGRGVRVSKQSTAPTSMARQDSGQEAQTESVGPSARHKTPKGRIREMYEREAMDQNAGDSGSEAAPPSGSGTPIHEAGDAAGEKAPSDLAKSQSVPSGAADSTSRLPIKKRRHVEAESSPRRDDSATRDVTRTSRDPSQSRDEPPTKKKGREGSATRGDFERRSNSSPDLVEVGPPFTSNFVPTSNDRIQAEGFSEDWAENHVFEEPEIEVLWDANSELIEDHEWSRSREPRPEDVSVLYQGVTVHGKEKEKEKRKENTRERFPRRDQHRSDLRPTPRDGPGRDGPGRDARYDGPPRRGTYRPQFGGRGGPRGAAGQKQWDGYKSNRPFRISQFAHYMDERAREIDAGPQSIFPQNQDGGVRIADFDPGHADRLINMATHRLHQGEISQAAYEDIVSGLEHLAASSGQPRRGPGNGPGPWMPGMEPRGPLPPGPPPRGGPAGFGPPIERRPDLGPPMRADRPFGARDNTPPPLFPPRSAAGQQGGPRPAFGRDEPGLGPMPNNMPNREMGPGGPGIRPGMGPGGPPNMGQMGPEENPAQGPFPIMSASGPNMGPGNIPPLGPGGGPQAFGGDPRANGAVKQEPGAWMPQYPPQNGPAPMGNGPPPQMGAAGPPMGAGGPPMAPMGQSGMTPVQSATETMGPAAIPPNKHIYVDGRAYEVQYIGDVAVIERSGLPHRIHFVGPPRDVVIDGVAYTLAFGERRSVTIDGQRHVMMFGGPSRELYLGSQPLRGSFGGPPIHLRINGVEHKIQLSGPPPEVKIEAEPDYENARFMPSASMARANIKHPQNQPPTSVTPTPAGVTIQQVVDPKNPNASMNSNAPAAPMNVAELVKKLINSGLIPGAAGQGGGEIPPTIVQKMQPRTAFTSMNDGPVIRKLKPSRGLQEFNMKDLRVRYTSEIQSLYPTAGQQCGMCGQRFDVQDLDAYSRHLDWHFHQNRLYQRQQSRPWFITADAWIDFNEMDTETREQVKTAMMETWAANRAAAASGPYGPEQSSGTVAGTAAAAAVANSTTGTNDVIAAEGQDQICDVCCEKLEQFWDEEEEIWKLKNAMQAPDGRIYHPTCYQDVSVNDTIRGFKVSALATSNVKREGSQNEGLPEIVDVVASNDDDLLIDDSPIATTSKSGGDGGATPLRDEREATPLRDEET